MSIYLNLTYLRPRVQIQLKLWNFGIQCLPCRDGGIGRHEGLKIPCLSLACGFNSRSRHQ